MPKPFSWSFSKLKNFETCQFKHQQVDLNKAFSESSEQLTWGNDVHDKLKNACLGNAALPVTMKEYQKWVDMIRGGSGELLAEQKYALTRKFEPTEWFSNRAWFRCIADIVKIDAPVALSWDWKTGKVVHDSVQLGLVAAAIFAHHPEIKKIRTDFVWLQTDETTRDSFTREDVADMWTHLLPRVARMEEAYTSGVYIKNPSGLCFKWCPVKTCEYHGKGNRR